MYTAAHHMNVGAEWHEVRAQKTKCRPFSLRQWMGVRGVLSTNTRLRLCLHKQQLCNELRLNHTSNEYLDPVIPTVYSTRLGTSQARPRPDASPSSHRMHGQSRQSLTN